jgi:hypothetical protein
MEQEPIGSLDGEGLALSESQLEVRVLDALGQAGLAEQTVCDLVELDATVVRDTLLRLDAQGHVVCSAAVDRRPAEPANVWVATPAGRLKLEDVFRQFQVDERIRKLLLLAVDDLSPTTPELTRRLRWHLPALGLRRLRDVHQGWVRGQLVERQATFAVLTR